MKYLLIIFTLLSSFCNAQITLKGYKCSDYGDVPPGQYSIFDNAHDTFSCYFIIADLATAIDDPKDDSKEQTDSYNKNMLETGLKLAFGSNKPTKTKDGLYYGTDRSPDGNYFYTVYDQKAKTMIQVYSRYNDHIFSERSKWLLDQVRKHRDHLYLQNDKGQRCDGYADRKG